MNESQILAYLKGEELSSSQAEAVEKWLQKEENKAEARALYQAWELSSLVSTKGVDKAKAWKAIKAGSEPVKNKFVVSWRAIGVAASFAVVALSALFLYDKYSTQPSLVFQADDRKLEVLTPDSSLLVLNKHASVKYTEADDSRMVYLKGEAYFEVKTKNDFPFIVQVFNTQIKVLGTKFRVKPLPDSSVQVLVTEGSVSVTNLRSGEIYIVKPHQELLISKKVQTRTSNENDLYWVTETLKFENQLLSDVFDILSNEFDIVIELANPENATCRITATFKKQQLQTILTVIEKTHSLTFTKDGNKYIVNGKGCHE